MLTLGSVETDNARFAKPFLFIYSFPWSFCPRYLLVHHASLWCGGISPCPYLPLTMIFPTRRTRLHSIYTFHHIPQTVVILSFLVCSSETFSTKRYNFAYRGPRGPTHCLPKLFVIWHLSCNFMLIYCRHTSTLNTANQNHR
jgi:hypothetical protein